MSFSSTQPEPTSKNNFLQHFDATKIEFRLRMDPKRKAVKTHKENEAIQFDFDIMADDFDEIANEMMKSGLILEEDSRAVAKLLKVQVYTLMKDRKERLAQAQAAAKEKELAKFQQALEQHHQQVAMQQQQFAQAQTQTNAENQPQQQQQQQIMTSQQQQTQSLSNLQPQINQISPQPQQNQSPMPQQVSVPPQQLSTPNQMQKPSDVATLQNTPTSIPQQQQPQQTPKLPQQNQGGVSMPSQSDLSQQQQQTIKTPQTMDSGIGSSTPQSASSTSSTLTKKRRQTKSSSERYPKLVVLRLMDEKVVECEMEVKPKTITFKFDVFEVNPDEVAKDLVRKKIYFSSHQLIYKYSQVDQELLLDEQSQIFIDIIKDIVRQVKHNSKQLPVVTIPHKYRQVSD